MPRDFDGTIQLNFSYLAGQSRQTFGKFYATNQPVIDGRPLGSAALRVRVPAAIIFASHDAAKFDTTIVVFTTFRAKHSVAIATVATFFVAIFALFCTVEPTIVAAAEFIATNAFWQSTLW